MRRFAGARRWVYNEALDLQQQRYARGEKNLSYAALCKEITAWRAQKPWLAEVHSQVLQQSLKDLGAAYTNFFEGRAEAPDFKKKGRSRESFRYPQLDQEDLDSANGRINLPKLPMDALPQEPGRARRAAQRHRVPVRRPVVREHPHPPGS